MEGRHRRVIDEKEEERMNPSIGYGQPSSNPSSSTNEEYGRVNHLHSIQKLYNVSYQMQE